MTESNPTPRPGKTRALSEERPPTWGPGPARRSVISAWAAVSAVILAMALMTDLPAENALWLWAVLSGLVLFIGLASCRDAGWDWIRSWPSSHRIDRA